MQRYNISDTLSQSFISLTPEFKAVFINELVTYHFDNYETIFEAQQRHNTANLPALKLALEAYQQRNRQRSVAHFIHHIDAQIRALEVKISTDQLMSFPFSALPADAQKQFMKIFMQKFIEESNYRRGIPVNSEAMIVSQFNHSVANIVAMRDQLNTVRNDYRDYYSDLAQCFEGYIATVSRIPAAPAVSPEAAAAIRTCVNNLRRLNILPAPVPTAFECAYIELPVEERKNVGTSLLRKNEADIYDYLQNQAAVGILNIKQLEDNMSSFSLQLMGHTDESRDHFNKVLKQITAFNAERQAEMIARQARQLDVVMDEMPEALPAAQNAHRAQAEVSSPVPSLLSSHLSFFSEFTPAAVRIADNRGHWIGALNQFLLKLTLSNLPANSAEYIALDTAVKTLQNALSTSNYDLLNQDVLNVLKQGELGKITENALKFVEQERAVQQPRVNGPR